MENVGTWSSDIAFFTLLCFLFPIALYYTLNMFIGIYAGCAGEYADNSNQTVEENESTEEYIPSANGHRWVIRNTWRTMKK